MKVKDTKKFQSNVKHYNLIRKPLRDSFLYGRYSKQDFVTHNPNLKERTASDLVRKINTYIPIQYQKTLKHGYYTFELDPFTCSINLLAESYLRCSYTIHDFFYYFYTMISFYRVIMEDPDCNHQKLFKNKINRIEVLETFEEMFKDNASLVLKTNNKQKLEQLCKNRCVEKTFLKKFTSLVDLGYLKESKYTDIDYINNRKILKYHYKLNSSHLETIYDLLCERSILYLLDFFSNYFFFSTPGFFLKLSMESHLIFLGDFENNKDKFELMNQSNDFFFYKKNKSHMVLDDEILWFLFNAIHHRKIIQFVYKKTNYEVYPLKIIVDNNYGRIYLAAYNFAFEQISLFKISFIDDIPVLKNKFKLFQYDIDEDTYLKYLSLYYQHSKYMWNVAYTTHTEKVLIHFKFPSSLFNQYLAKINKDKRHGTVTIKNQNEIDFEIEVTNSKEMLPWIRSFGYFAKVDKNISPDLYRIMKEDLRKVLNNYESI